LNLGWGYFVPRSTQPSIPPGLVNEYQLWLGRQGMAHSTCGWNAGYAGKTVISLDNACYTWASALETLHVEALYKLATFTFIVQRLIFAVGCEYASWECCCGFRPLSSQLETTKCELLWDSVRRATVTQVCQAVVGRQWVVVHCRLLWGHQSLTAV